MSTAIFPGSFDPITRGHMDIIERAAKIFDRVIVCITVNSAKTKPMFSVDEKYELIKKSVTHLPNVETDIWNGLLADYVRKYDNAVLIKGIRTTADLEYEATLDSVNKSINPHAESLFFHADPKLTFLSSTVVREMARYGVDLTQYVPDAIIEDVEKKAEIWRQLQ